VTWLGWVAIDYFQVKRCIPGAAAQGVCVWVGIGGCDRTTRESWWFLLSREGVGTNGCYVGWWNTNVQNIPSVVASRKAHSFPSLPPAPHHSPCDLRASDGQLHPTTAMAPTPR
jgi:hypothetical protein